MKRKLLFLCWLSGVTLTSAAGQSPDQMFQRANLLYQQGNMTEARTAYESILQNGYVSGELYYNLGNAYYKTGNMAKAILNYERALRLMPQDEDLQHNLQLASLLITDRIEPTPRLFIWDYWEDVKHAFSMSGITWLTYLAFLAVIGFLVCVVLASSFSMRRIGIVGTGAATVVFLVLVVIYFGKISDLKSNDTAIVTANITTAKNSPDVKSSDAFVLHSGVKVQITDSVNDWVKVRLADGKVGWLEKGAAEVI